MAQNALVFYLYGLKNAGDMAICLGLIEILKAKGYRITFVSRFHAADVEYGRAKAFVQSYHPDVCVEPGVFRLDRAGGAVRKVLSYAHGMGWLLMPCAHPRLRALIDAHDRVFFAGGNLLRGDKLTDYARLAALFYPIRIARGRGKPAVCLPQSTAALSREGKWLLGRALGLFARVFIRESASFAQLRALYPNVRFSLSTDLAFFMEDRAAAAASVAEPDAGGRRVALVLRGTGIGDIGALAPARQAQLLDTVRAYVQDHPENAYTLVVQTDKDEAFSHAFMASLPGKTRVNLVSERDAYRIRRIFAGMDITLSMRLHACILSLAAGTPVAGVFDAGWGLKNPGILSDYGMPWTTGEEPLADMLTRIQPGCMEAVRAKIARERAALVAALPESGQDFTDT